MGPDVPSIVNEQCVHYRNGTYISIGAQLTAAGGEFALKSIARAKMLTRLADNVAKGRKFEDLLRALLNVDKNTALIKSTTMAGRAVNVVHDAETCTEIIEFKNVNILSKTPQIEGQINHAKKARKIFHLVVDSRTKLTRPLLKLLKDEGAMLDEYDQVSDVLTSRPL